MQLLFLGMEPDFLGMEPEFLGMEPDFLRTEPDFPVPNQEIWCHSKINCDELRVICTDLLKKKKIKKNIQIDAKCRCSVEHRIDL